jgi:hypothetical protein
LLAEGLLMFAHLGNLVGIQTSRRSESATGHTRGR